MHRVQHACVSDTQNSTASFCYLLCRLLGASYSVSRGRSTSSSTDILPPVVRTAVQHQLKGNGYMFDTACFVRMLAGLCIQQSIGHPLPVATCLTLLASHACMSMHQAEHRTSVATVAKQQKRVLHAFLSVRLCIALHSRCSEQCSPHRHCMRALESQPLLKRPI